MEHTKYEAHVEEALTIKRRNRRDQVRLMFLFQEAHQDGCLEKFARDIGYNINAANNYTAAYAQFASTGVVPERLDNADVEVNQVVYDMWNDVFDATLDGRHGYGQVDREGIDAMVKDMGLKGATKAYDIAKNPNSMTAAILGDNKCADAALQAIFLLADRDPIIRGALKERTSTMPRPSGTPGGRGEDRADDARRDLHGTAVRHRADLDHPHGVRRAGGHDRRCHRGRGRRHRTTAELRHGPAGPRRHQQPGQRAVGRQHEAGARSRPLGSAGILTGALIELRTGVHVAGAPSSTDRLGGSRHGLPEHGRPHRQLGSHPVRRRQPGRRRPGELPARGYIVPFVCKWTDYRLIMARGQGNLFTAALMGVMMDIRYCRTRLTRISANLRNMAVGFPVGSAFRIAAEDFATTLAGLTNSTGAITVVIDRLPILARRAAAAERTLLRELADRYTS